MAAVIWICYKTQHYFFYTYDFTASLKEQRCCLSLHFISFNFEMTIEGDVVPHGSVCQNKTTSKIRLDNSIVNMLKNAACRKKNTVHSTEVSMWQWTAFMWPGCVFLSPLFSWWLLWETMQPRPNMSRRFRLSTTDRHTVTASKCSFIQLWLFKTRILACKHDIYWNSLCLNRVNICQLKRPS